MIVSLSTWTTVTCNQQFSPGKTLWWGATGGVVEYQGEREVMVCGGLERKGCHVWTEEGWVKTNSDYER